MPLPAFGRALAHRNYRLFILGQGVSFVGTWMQQVAISWLVYEMARARFGIGRASFLLGVVAFAGQMPTFFLAPVAGVLSDHLNRRRTLMVTQLVAMGQALALVALMLHGTLELWHVVVLSIVMGAVNAFDMPTRQAFLIDIIPDRADLPNAIALNSSMVNSARLIGPAFAGLILYLGGPIPCFALNALSYVAVLVALVAMRDLPAQAARPTVPVLQGLADGFSYSFGFRPIRALLLLLAFVGLLGIPAVTTLLPVFADDVLHGGARLFGFLTAASGIGALGAGLYLASRKTVLGLGRQVAWATALFGGALIIFGMSRSVPLSLVAAVAVGFFMMLQLAGSNTLLQIIVDDDKRGRVMALYTMSFMGTAPLGSLLAGALAHWRSAPFALVVSGGACIVAALAFARGLPAWREQVRPIYQRVGILPEIAVALEGAAELTAPPEEPA